MACPSAEQNNSFGSAKKQKSTDKNRVPLVGKISSIDCIHKNLKRCSQNGKKEDSHLLADFLRRTMIYDRDEIPNVGSSLAPSLFRRHRLGSLFRWWRCGRSRGSMMTMRYHTSLWMMRRHHHTPFSRIDLNLGPNYAKWSFIQTSRPRVLARWNSRSRPLTSRS